MFLRCRTLTFFVAWINIGARLPVGIVRRRALWNSGVRGFSFISSSATIYTSSSTRNARRFDRCQFFSKVVDSIFPAEGDKRP